MRYELTHPNTPDTRKQNCSGRGTSRKISAERSGIKADFGEMIPSNHLNTTQNPRFRTQKPRFAPVTEIPLAKNRATPYFSSPGLTPFACDRIVDHGSALRPN